MFLYIDYGHAQEQFMENLGIGALALALIIVALLLRWRFNKTLDVGWGIAAQWTLCASLLLPFALLLPRMLSP